MKNWTQEDMKMANLRLITGLDNIDSIDDETLENWILQLRKKNDHIKVYMAICYLEEKLKMDDHFYDVIGEVLTRIDEKRTDYDDIRQDLEKNKRIPPKHKLILIEWLKDTIPTRAKIEQLIKGNK